MACITGAMQEQPRGRARIEPAVSELADDLIQDMFERIHQRFHVDTCALLLLDRAGEHLVAHAARVWGSAHHTRAACATDAGESRHHDSRYSTSTTS